MRYDKERMLRTIDGLSKGGHPPIRSGLFTKDMVDLDDLVVVPAASVSPSGKNIDTKFTIGIKRYSHHPIDLGTPVYIADFSYGQIGRSAKSSLAYGAAMARSMILAGPGSLLDEEQEIVNELDGHIIAKWSKGRHGNTMEQLSFCDGICIDMASAPNEIVPSSASTKEVSEVFGVKRGEAITQPFTHLDLLREDDLKHHIGLLREALQYEVPIMVKFSGGDIYEKTRAAIEANAEAVVLQGMHGWRARSTEVMTAHAGEPVIAMIPPALRAFIDTKAKSRGVKLLVQGGILSGADAFKALAMGADGIGLDTAAIIAIGCRLMGVCHTGKCPQGIATIDPKLEAKVDFKQAGERLSNLLSALTIEMVALAKYAGLKRLSDASMKNLRALTYDAAAITGVRLLGFDRSLPIWLQ